MRARDTIMGQIGRLVLCVCVALMLTPNLCHPNEIIVPDSLRQKAYDEGAVRVIVQLRVSPLPEGEIRGVEQPVPAPGPSPISPGSGPQSPPEVLPPPEKATEVPIGRLEGYEEEKRKALEIPFDGRSPGTIQEDPAVHRRRTETGSCDGR